MSGIVWPYRNRLLVSSLALVVVLFGGCGLLGVFGGSVEDAGGLTRFEVRKLSLEEEYQLLSERYTLMENKLEEAQLVIHDGIWEWGGGDTLPLMGIHGPTGIQGGTSENCYYIEATRRIFPEGAVGAVEDLDPMIEYAKSKEWEYAFQDMSSGTRLRIATDDRWLFMYEVQKNGQYNLSIYSDVYWTNDTYDLLMAVGERMTPDYEDGTQYFPNESLPGEYVPFPKWD